MCDAAIRTKAAERRGAPRPADTPSALATRWAKVRVEEKSESSPEEAMEAEDWASDQVVRMVGGQDRSWLFLFPFVERVLPSVFLSARMRPYYDRSGRSGLRKTGK